MLLLLLACTDPGASAPEGPGCPAGTVEEEGACVPEACAGGPFGGAEGDLWVDADSAGGDGSREAPFPTISEAVAAAERGDRIAIAAGTYAEALALDHKDRELSLVGACRDRVVLDASGEKRGSAVVVEAEAGDAFALSGLTIAGGPQFGISVLGGELRVEGVRIRDTGGSGLFVSGAESRVVAEGLEVLDSRDDPGVGMGVAVQDEGELEATDLRVERAETIGISVISGGRATLRFAVVDQEGVATGGASVDSATVELEDVALLHSTGVGLEAYESTVILDGFRVDEVLRPGENKGAYGLAATASTVQGRGLHLSATQRHALVMSDCDFDLEGVEIEGVHPGEYRYSPGAVVVDGSAGRLREVSVHDNTGLGVVFIDSEVELLDVEVREQHNPESTPYTGGVQLQGGSFDVEGLRVEGVEGLGLILTSGAVGTVRDLTVRDLRSEGVSQLAIGLSVEKEADVVVEGALIEEVAMVGVQVARARAELRDLEVRATGGLVIEGLWTAVQAYDGAELLLEDSFIHDLVGTGVGAVQEGTQATVRRVRIADTRGHPGQDGGLGLSSHLGAQLTVEDVEVLRPTHAGLQVGVDGATAVVDGLVITDVQPAVFDGLTVARGAEVIYGGGAEIRDLVVDGAQELGVLVQSEAHLWLSGAEISAVVLSSLGREAMGLSVELGSTGEVEDLWVHDTLGSGVHEADSELSCTRCVVERVAFGGAVAEGGRLELVDSAIREVAASGTMGGGMGIFADTAQHGFTELSVQGCTVEGAAMSGVYLQGQGAYALVDSAIAGAAGLDYGGHEVHGEALFARDGVMPWDGEAGLLVQKSTLNATDGHRGVLLDGASARFEESGVQGGDLALRQQSCGADLPPPEGADSLGTTDICPQWGEVVIVVDYEYYSMDAVVAQ